MANYLNTSRGSVAVPTPLHSSEMYGPDYKDLRDKPAKVYGRNNFRKDRTNNYPDSCDIPKCKNKIKGGDKYYTIHIKGVAIHFCEECHDAGRIPA